MSSGTGAQRLLFWFCAVVTAVLLVSIVIGYRRECWLDADRLAGSPDALLTHYRAVLTQTLDSNRSLWAVSWLGLVGGFALTTFGSSGIQALIPALPYIGLTISFLGLLIYRLSAARLLKSELAALPPAPPLSADLKGRVRELVLRGKKLQAIIEWREATSASLAEAKAAVEALAAEEASQ
jgi:hypothetical protein